MRIIAGIYKSRSIKAPSKKANIRPSTDFIRETVFNILANYIDFEKVNCIDLFCGTGSYGLESLSRGVKKCYFIDINIKLVKENISLLNVGNKVYIHKADAIKFLELFKNKTDEFVVFADPPYSYKNYSKLIKYASFLNSYFILEHSNKFNSSEFEIKPFIQKKIGTSKISIYNFLKESKV